RLFSFGAISDVQYADCDDGWNFKQTYRRYYRGGLVQLRKAVDVWLGSEEHQFVLQLGDLIDGRNSPVASEAALSATRRELDRLAKALPLGVLSSLGNHELYNFPKERWARELDCTEHATAVALAPPVALPQQQQPPPPPPPPSGEVKGTQEWKAQGGKQEAGDHRDGKEGEEGQGQVKGARFYFSFSPEPSFRFLSLYSYDVNGIRTEAGPEGEDKEEEGEEAGESSGGDYASVEELLGHRNPNMDKNSPEGMSGIHKR
ncbi:unnamed protein product, partial [Choristocarpus tenellus]